MTGRCWKLSPSDFAFLWEECRRCFYLKVVSDYPRPRPAMPKIFATIDEQMKRSFEGRRTEAIAPGMPPGIFDHADRWVESLPIDVHVPEGTFRCFLRGRIDTLLRLDDGTWAVVDFKTSERRAEHIPLYTRQLHAYAHALERPAPGQLGLGPISRLGLLVFEPEKFSTEPASPGTLTGHLSWIEVPRDDTAFVGFLAEVLTVLERDTPPGGTPLCEWCVYRDASRRTGL